MNFEPHKATLERHPLQMILFIYLFIIFIILSLFYFILFIYLCIYLFIWFSWIHASGLLSPIVNLRLPLMNNNYTDIITNIKLKSHILTSIFYITLYNNVTSVCIFIGCWSWSIKGHTHRWRQIHVRFTSADLLFFFHAPQILQ